MIKVAIIMIIISSLSDTYSEIYGYGKYQIIKENWYPIIITIIRRALVPNETTEAAKGILLSWPMVLGSVLTISSTVASIILYLKKVVKDLRDEFHGKDREQLQQINDHRNRLSLVELTNTHQTTRIDDLSDKVGHMQEDITEIKIKISENHGETMGALGLLMSNMSNVDKNNSNK